MERLGLIEDFHPDELKVLFADYQKELVRDYTNPMEAPLWVE